jgi:hypothetical protein
VVAAPSVTIEEEDMNLKRTMVLCALALGVLAVGCGNSCKSNCDDYKKCAVSPIPSGLSCDTFCDDVDNVSDAASCNSQKDKLLDCEDGVKDKCATDSADKCDSQQTAWDDCLNTYCKAHPDDKDCAKWASDVFSALGGST